MNPCYLCGFEDDRHAWWCSYLTAKPEHECWELGPDDGTNPPF